MNIDISKLKVKRIAENTQLGIIDDFFSFDEYDIDIEEQLDAINYEEFPYNARAFCLYAALLMTKQHETSPELFDAHYTERKQEVIACLLQKPKYAHYTAEQLDAKAEEIIMKEIRNCFAHGNFGISFIKGTKKLFFVLTPDKFETVSNNPIVVSAENVSRILHTFVADNSFRYERSLNYVLNRLDLKLDDALKELMLPLQMLKIADYYEDNCKVRKSDVLYSDKIYTYLQYVLLSTKITYEQDDYYRTFGPDSDVFRTICLVRNALSHDGMNYENMAKELSFTDRNRNEKYNLPIMASKLLIFDNQKRVLKKNMQEPDMTPEMIEKMKESFEHVNDILFNSNIPFEDIVKALDAGSQKNK